MLLQEVIIYFNFEQAGNFSDIIPNKIWPEIFNFDFGQAGNSGIIIPNKNLV